MIISKCTSLHFKMRIAALLLIVFGSTECNYNIAWHNDLKKDIIIQVTRNSTTTTRTLFAYSSQTYANDFDFMETSRVEYQNLHVATYPRLIPDGGPWTNVEVGLKKPSH
ncbi:hypothetical protein PRIPAC_89938 [Pristionchus pacificus]|uniref:Uncharacterized protein n=1 Tax=Pristionchus pacificus TaxID=54126 RepID=A0A2A6B6D2_PRIPA|nr:hypothetical protein PRIPAC_89938 [Pristionchus pacificus]|eukprot:PDM61437.1 hypothetical protein PRIPAC_50879 [Pristionchus pacificus]